jgi:hypothetical protein
VQSQRQPSICTQLKCPDSDKISANIPSLHTELAIDYFGLRSAAMDCGRVAIAGNPKVASGCALAAQSAGKPFRVRYDIQGFDSFVAVAIVRTPIRTVGALQYDSDPAGGGGRAHEVVYPKRCPEPVHLWLNPSGRINCFQKESSRPKDVMSPKRGAVPAKGQREHRDGQPLVLLYLFTELSASDVWLTCRGSQR